MAEDESFGIDPMMSWYWNLLLGTLRMDTVSLIPNSSHEPLHANLQLELGNKPTHFAAPVLHLFGFFWRILVAWRHPGKPLPTSEPGLIHFIGFSSNQIASLSPIQSQLSSRCPSVLWTRESFRRLLFWAYPLSLPFLPCLLYRWLTSRGYRRTSFRWSTDDYWLNYGLYLVWRCWLRRTSPSSVLIGNDHVQMSCVLAVAARDEGIPTWYVQHACVTEAFPPLTTDYALLDGVDAAEKYAAAGPSSTKVFLVGIGKFDAFSARVRTSQQFQNLGICFSMADSLDRSQELLEALAKHSVSRRVAVTARPHPRMSPASIEQLKRSADEFGFAWSEPSVESSFDFLCRQDVMICGLSAIALEAALVNVVPLNYQLNLEHTDWYGFIRNGLTRSTDDVQGLLEWLEEFEVSGTPPVRHLAMRYCATINSRWDGHSAELAALVIEATLQADASNSLDSLGMRLAPIGTLSVYGLAEDSSDATKSAQN